MREVISFRLSKDNPREAQARAVLKVWVDKGYGVRHVLTEALLVYQGSKKDMDIQELSVKLDEIRKLLQQNSTPTNLNESEVALSDRFLTSIRKGAKPGIGFG
jgi:hypothetical protein